MKKWEDLTVKEQLEFEKILAEMPEETALFLASKGLFTPKQVFETFSNLVIGFADFASSVANAISSAADNVLKTATGFREVKVELTCADCIHSTAVREDGTANVIYSCLRHKFDLDGSPEAFTCNFVSIEKTEEQTV